MILPVCVLLSVITGTLLSKGTPGMKKVEKCQERGTVGVNPENGSYLNWGEIKEGFAGRDRGEKNNTYVVWKSQGNMY